MTIDRSTNPDSGAEIAPDDVEPGPDLSAPPVPWFWRPRVEAVAFILIWIALGAVLPLGPAGYLVLGVPLAVVFQLVVRRRPLRELWIRSAGGHRAPGGLVLTA